MKFVFRVLVACVLIGASAAAGAYFLGYFGKIDEAATRARQTPPVIVAGVERRELIDEIEAIGTTYANEAITLAAPVTELITSVNFTDGQKVKRGDILIELATQVEKAQLQAAEATLAEARKQLERIQTLAKQGNAAETRLDEQIRARDIATAEVTRIKAEIERRIMRAPFDGTIGFKRVSPGALVQPGTELAALQDVSTLKLDFTVPELYFTNVEEGQKILARTPVYPNREFTGEISAIEPSVDPVSRAFAVRAILPNKDSELKPGMLMTVRIIRERVQALMVPEQSVVFIGPRSYVYKLEAGNIVRRTEFKAGRREPGFIEVVSGLTENDTIIVEGTIRVQDGMTVAPQEREGGGTNPLGSADASQRGRG